MQKNRQTRPVAAARAKAPVRQRRFPRDLAGIIVAAVILLAGAVLLEVIWPNGFPIEAQTTSGTDDAISEIHSAGPLRINELMTSNSETLRDASGSSPDWIEIMNIGNSAADLKDYVLAKKSGSTSVFTFPDVTLQAGDCAIVYADGTLSNAADGEWHAPFRLSSLGGTLMLVNPSGTAVDTVNFPALEPDQAYVRAAQSIWEASFQTTPGLPNTQENWDAIHAPMENSDVEISEIVAKNTKYAADENGLFQDYIELHNRSDAVVDLSGWFLSDDAEKTMRWKLPEGFQLGAGEYRIVYASGQDKPNTDHPHTSFGLSTEGETVTLTDPNGRIADQVTFDLLKGDQAWSRDAQGNWAIAEPSPNSVNP